MNRDASSIALLEPRNNVGYGREDVPCARDGQIRDVVLELADNASFEQVSRLVPRAAVDDLSADANEHFDHEEQNIVPLIGECITPKEWKDFIDRGAAYVNPRNLWFALAYAGLLLRDATPDEQTRFIAAVPFALRMVLKLLGGRAHGTYRTRLYGVSA